MLESTIRLYIENKYQGMLYQEMKLLLQKKIYTEMLLDGEMLIKDNKLCLKINSHIGNCNFYLFENGTCMLGTTVYDFIKVSFVTHKDYNKFAQKLAIIIQKSANKQLLDLDVNKFKLYMLSGSTLKIAKLQYLCAINKNEQIKDNYKEFYEDLKQINEDYPLDYSRYTSDTRYRIISEEIEKTIEKKYTKWVCKEPYYICTDYFDFDYLTLEREDLQRCSYYWDNRHYLVIKLKKMWQFAFEERQLQEFINLQSVEEILQWLKITDTKIDKSYIRQEFVEEIMRRYLKYDLEKYIQTHRQTSYSPVRHIPLENFINQFQLIQEFFNNNPFLKPLGKALNIL